MTQSTKAGGFSLVEVLVALLLASALVVAFSASALLVMKINRESERITRGTSLGQAQLATLTGDAEAGRPLVPGSRSQDGILIEWDLPVVAGLPAGITPLRVRVTWAVPNPRTLSFETVVDG